MLTPEQIEALARPFGANEIEWRVGQAGKGARGPWVKPLAYLTSRAVMERLDEVFGVGGWSNTIREVNLGEISDEKGRATPLRGIVCTLHAGGAEHEDVAECSDIEPLKGAASGALKRVAVHFGIGRYLYYLEGGFGTVTPNGKFRHCGKDRKTGEALDFRWNPPELPAWALPSSSADSVQDVALVIPETVPVEFTDGIRTILESTKAAQKLRANYTHAAEKLRGMGDTDFGLVLAPKLTPCEIANELLKAKARIIAIESAPKSKAA